MTLREKILNYVDAMIDNKREYVIASMEFDDSYVLEDGALTDFRMLKSYIEFRKQFLESDRLYDESLMCQIIDALLQMETKRSDEVV